MPSPLAHGFTVLANVRRSRGLEFSPRIPAAYMAAVGGWQDSCTPSVHFHFTDHKTEAQGREYIAHDAQLIRGNDISSGNLNAVMGHTNEGKKSWHQSFSSFCPLCTHGSLPL